MRKPQHFSWLVSPYSAKTRSYLTYKGVDFDDVVPSARTLSWTIRRAVGRAIMPTVRLPDGVWLQDSSVIIDHFEATHPSPPTTPPGPSQRLASALIDLFADEWMPMAALHYRWSIPQNKAFALNEFARNGLPWVPRPLAIRAIRPIAARMEGYLPLLGVDGTTAAGVEATTTQTIDAVERTLQHHPYLFGDRPCLADFSLYGPLWSHLYRDPGSTRLFDAAPAVVSWMERLRTGRHAAGGDFLPDDQVPATLDPLFTCIVEDLLPWLHTLVGAINNYCDTHPDASRVPRALGTAPFRIRGQHGSRKLVTFVQWKAQRSRDAYDHAQGAADDWLARVGCDDPETALPPIPHPFALRDYKAVLA